MALRSFMVFFSLKVTLSPAELLNMISTWRGSTGGGDCFIASGMAVGMASVGGGVLTVPLSTPRVFETGELLPSAMASRACVTWWMLMKLDT